MPAPGLTLGVIGTSRKENERRAPLDPAHFGRIPEALRERIRFQRGYGERFGVRDGEIERAGFGVLPTGDLVARSDIVLLAKPTEEDFPLFREGLVLWGWPHCVQGEAITQVAVDRKMTLIAWEAMNLWPGGEERGLHVFHRNNELAGYCAVMHACELAGITGRYGAPRRVAVIEFGLTARGSIHALQGLGFDDLTCYTQRPPEDLPARIGGVRHLRYARDADTGDASVLLEDGTRRPMAEELAGYDLIVNCIFQDTDRPILFLRAADLGRLRRGALIVDVSCDRGMGFEWARPTGFDDPVFEVGEGVVHYAVDHTPSYLWRAATWEISRALLPYLPAVMAGPEAWDREIVIRKAIEIREGRILNPKILSAQDRAAEYPHAKR